MDNVLKLHKEILACNDCKELFGFEPHPVVHGNQNSKIVQVSQAPSANVHKTGVPFDDVSGKRLRSWYNIIDEIFYDKNNFYITGIAHCFPGKDGKGGDRKPPIHCAKKWLHKELAAVDNKIYIFIGRESSKFIFPDKDFKELIFTNQILNGKPAFVLPHPSPLNMKWLKDNPDFEKKRLPYIRKKIHEVINL